MLKIVIPEQEAWDQSKEEFVYIKSVELSLEHSLVSISKWEQKWHKSFLSRRKGEKMSIDEFKDYVRCMTLTQNVDPVVYNFLTPLNIKEIDDYMNDPMTATTITEDKKHFNNKIITSELVYYWMISLNIPLEFQKWHFNRLMTLIRVCEIYNTPPKKMGKRNTVLQNAKINAERKAALNTRG